MPTTTDNVAAYRCFIEEFCSGRELPAADYVTDDFVRHWPTEEKHGPASLDQAMVGGPRRDRGDHVPDRCRAVRTGRLDCGPVARGRDLKAGQPIAFPGDDIARVRAGKISEYWDSTITSAS